MGSLVWSTTGASSQGSSPEGWLGPAPQARTLTHQGVSQDPFQGALGKPLPLPPGQPVLSCEANIHTSPPPHPAPKAVSTFCI